jgi:hypothetical protein
MQRLSKKPPRREQDDDGDHQAHCWIQPTPPRSPDQRPGHHDTQRDARIGREVQEGRANVHVVLSTTKKEKRRGRVDDDPKRCDCDDRRPFDGTGIGEPSN